jgi:hypothetical protein
MRIWGRIYPTDAAGNRIPRSKGTWVMIETTPAGKNDEVYLTNLIQVLKLNINESPFFADRGIPAHPSVTQQVFPDWYVWEIQRQFSPFFASLIVAKVPAATPTYNIDVTTNEGFKMPTVQVAT